MANECPKCQTKNPEDSKFCKECATPLPGIKAGVHTKTLETPSEELKRGSVFAGRYEIIEELGKGGMGKVYRVEDKKIKEEVALKLLKPEIASDKKTIERFSNELKMARKIVHKNVGRMYDINEERGNHFITMEYVAGQDLKGMIRQSRQLTVGTTILIAKQMCDGLSEAHKLGIVHRDLKPSNTVIDKEGNAHIMDFGIARSLKEKGITGSGIMIGTPEYMSPEQVEAKEIDQRSDIYSLGIILYEMLTGRVPFEGDSPFSIGIKHKSEIPGPPMEINPRISGDLNLLILKCLEKDQEKRYQSAAEVKEALEAIEIDMPTTERAVPKRKTAISKEVTLTLNIKKLLLPVMIIAASIVAFIVAWQLFLKKDITKTSIAVISFENQTGEESYDYLQKAIPNLLITSLEQSKYLSVTTWERMYDLLKQIGKEDFGAIDRELGFELCRMEGVDGLVLGSFVKAGDVFATDVKVLDVRTKKLLKSAQSKGEGVGSILNRQIGELSKEISRGVGLPEQKIEPSQLRIADMTTSSMEAYNYFLQGREAYEKFYYDEARKYLEKAVQLDPEFAVAYLYLSQALSVLEMPKESLAAREKAKAFAEDVSEKERLYIEASFASDEKRLSILQEAAEKYPKEKQIHYWLAHHYNRTEMFEEAIKEYEKALDLDPSYGYALNSFAYMYSDMGEYEKSIEYFERYASVNPEDANPIDSMAELYFRMGRLDESIEKYKNVLKIRPDFFQSYWRIGYVYALKEDYPKALEWCERDIAAAPTPGAKMTGYYWKAIFNNLLGDFDQALNDSRILFEIGESIGSDSGKAMASFGMFQAHFDRGEYEQSRNHSQNWYEFFIKENSARELEFRMFVNLFFGFLDIKEGNLGSARSRLTEIESNMKKIFPLFKNWIQFSFDMLQGELLLAEGSVDQAIAYLEGTAPIGKPPLMQNMDPYNYPFIKDVLARAYQKKGELDKAIAEYKRLVSFDPDSECRCLIHPIYYYRLAKLYEKKDMTTEAVRNYDKFLSLWESADAGLPEVEDAKNRLENLQKTPKF